MAIRQLQRHILRSVLVMKQQIGKITGFTCLGTDFFFKNVDRNENSCDNAQNSNLHAMYQNSQSVT